MGAINGGGTVLMFQAGSNLSSHPSQTYVSNK